MTFNKVCELLEELKEEVPKSIRLKLNDVTTVLEGNEDKGLRVNKALTTLEELSDHQGIDQQTRMQLFSVVSMLESSRN